jgi:hypothetical protein
MAVFWCQQSTFKETGQLACSQIHDSYHNSQPSNHHDQGFPHLCFQFEQLISYSCDIAFRGRIPSSWQSSYAHIGLSLRAVLHLGVSFSSDQGIPQADIRQHSKVAWQSKFL